MRWWQTTHGKIGQLIEFSWCRGRDLNPQDQVVGRF